MIDGLEDFWKNVGRMLENCWKTVGKLWGDC